MHTLLPLLLTLAAAPTSQVRVFLRDAQFDGVSATVELVQNGKTLKRLQTHEGNLTLELPPGRYQLRLSSPELCSTSVETLQVERGEDLETPFQLARCERLTGRAFAKDGQPLSGGTIVLRYAKRTEDASARTDAAGRFTFGRVVKDTFEVLLQDARGKDVPASARRSPSGELEVRATRMVHFFVRDPSGKALENAFIRLVAEPLQSVNREGRTGPRGMLSLPIEGGLRYRALVLWEKEDAFSRHAWKDFSAPTGAEDLRLTLQLRLPSRSTLRGRVVDADGKPLVGARVSATQLFPTLPLDDAFLRNTAYPRTSETTRTDDSGRYAFQAMPPGEAWVRVEHPHQNRETVVRLSASTPDLVIANECARRVTGRAVDEQGAPLTQLQRGATQLALVSGRFELEHECGLIYLGADGYLDQRLRMPVPTPVHVALGDIVFGRGRRIQGRLSRADGAPARGESVDAQWSHPSWQHKQARVADTGRFSLGPVTATEDVFLAATVDDVVLGRRIPPGQRGQVLLQAPQGPPTLEVRVLDVEGNPLPRARVTAEGASSSVGVRGDASGRIAFALPAGSYRLLVEPERPFTARYREVPMRFAATTVRVPASGTVSAVLRAVRGAGKLRVLLPRWTHYDDVLLVAGAVPWPGHGHAVLDLAGKAVPQDPEADTWSQPSTSVIGYSILTDFNDLAPGTYTVFAKRSYGDDAGEVYFRKAIEVSGKGRQVVQVRFEGPEARKLPW